MRVQVAGGRTREVGQPWSSSDIHPATINPRKGNIVFLSTITFDLTPVTDNITALKDAISGASGLTLVIGAALAVAAIVWGGKKLWGVFKRFTS